MSSKRKSDISGLTILRADTSHSSGILTCLRTAFAPYQASYTAAAYEDTILTPAGLMRRLETMTILVTTTPGNAVLGTIAFSRVNGADGHLRGMAVLPEWQGAGLAQQLLEHAESQLREAGCARVTLDTTEPLKRAVRFYERNGYLATGETTDFFGMPLFEYAKPL